MVLFIRCYNVKDDTLTRKEKQNEVVNEESVCNHLCIDLGERECVFMRGVHVLRGVSICIACKNCFGRESWTSLESCSTVYDDCMTACIHKHVILRMPNPSANTQSDCVGR